ncbi:hypothetical protein ACFLUV_04745 [Elusimicrobiota bacterium]
MRFKDNNFQKYLVKAACGITALFIYCLLSGNCLYGAFLDPGWGARPTGIGGAFTSLSDDACGPLWNPAGIARVRKMETTFTYAMPYMNLDLCSGPDTTDLGMNFGSFLYPFNNWGTIGFCMTSLTASNLYSENVYMLSYGLSAGKAGEFTSKIIPKKKGEFDDMGWEEGQAAGRTKHITYLGMNIKYLSHKYVLDRYAEIDPVFSGGNSKSAISLDFGIMVIFNNRLSTGLMIKDLNGPDVGIKEKDKVPSEMRIGAGYNMGRFMPCLDLSYRNKLFNTHIGCEFAFKPLLIRAGFNLDEITTGFGFCTKLVQLDYSFIWPLYIKESFGTHRASLSLRFGTARSEAEEEDAAEKQEEPYKRAPRTIYEKPLEKSEEQLKREQGKLLEEPVKKPEEQPQQKEIEQSPDRFYQKKPIKPEEEEKPEKKKTKDSGYQKRKLR